MRRTIQKQDKPIYRWKLTNDKKIVKEGPVYEWEIEEWGFRNTEKRYIFRMPNHSTLLYVRPELFDAVSHSMMYSFTDDDNKAKEAFLVYFQNKVKDADLELEKHRKNLQDYMKSNS